MAHTRPKQGRPTSSNTGSACDTNADGDAYLQRLIDEQLRADLEDDNPSSDVDTADSASMSTVHSSEGDDISDRSSVRREHGPDDIAVDEGSENEVSGEEPPDEIAIQLLHHMRYFHSAKHLDNFPRSQALSSISTTAKLKENKHVSKAFNDRIIAAHVQTNPNEEQARIKQVREKEPREGWIGHALRSPSPALGWLPTVTKVLPWVDRRVRRSEATVVQIGGGAATAGGCR